MRLQAIKLAGFKSFVDPTTVPFPSNLCAVVGPNGCGKSNIIDAVRWVMGESSAKTLRGESMADVIFNGSNTRKPVGQANIELLFDNTEGRLTGEYAAYSELSIKRQVTRDGQSNYFLNNQKCRRRDITDIFLGTGLGPRSYSIIEQGMISNLIEAKPEELRVYIEEAAGISKYKERRRETERRISHTRDNLDRLSDLRDELERQLLHLERQAKSAERYKALKVDERSVQAQLFALKWQTITTVASEKENNIGRLQVEQEARVADQRRVDAEIEQKRAELTDLSDAVNECQKRYYDHGTEIARIEDGIQFQNERNRQLAEDLEQVSGNGFKVRADIDSDQRKLGELRHQLQGSEPEGRTLAEAEGTSSRQLVEAEQGMQEWQQHWDTFNQQSATSRNQGQLQQSRIESLEQSIERLNNRLSSVNDEMERLEGLRVEEEIPPLEAMLETQQSQAERIEAELGDLNIRIETQRGENQDLQDVLDRQRRELQEVKGREASLEALQQAALGQEDNAEMSWLDRHHLATAARMGEQIKVEDRWSTAVETVLGDYLQAVCVDGVDAVANLLDDFEKGTLNFVAADSGNEAAAPDAGTPDAGTPAAGTPDAGTPDAGTPDAGTPDAGMSAALLLSQVTSPLDLSGRLHGVYTADTLQEALAMRSRLKAEDSVITPEGIWLGKHWLRISRDKDATAGVLMRQKELESLREAMVVHEQTVTDVSASLEAGVLALKLAEEERDMQSRRLAEQQRSASETRAQLGAKQLQAEQIKSDLGRARKETEQAMEELTQDEVKLKEARNELQSAMDQMEQDLGRKVELEAQRETLRESLQGARDKSRQDRDAAHQLALRVQTLNSQVTATEQAMVRLQEQQAVLNERRETLEQSIAASEEPQNQLKQELEVQLEKRLVVETELTGLRQKTEAVEHEIRGLEQQRSRFEEEVEQVRTSLDQVRMEWQALEVRRSTIREQLEAEQQDLDEVLKSLPEDADEQVWEENLTRIGNRIQRLGAINLAAIEEFKTQSERKQYLDTQNEDLEKALSTLENAIRKIDVETRTRFKETFDAVNSKLQQLFPKVFGGGHAYLEMTGEDLLDTGVGLMARPPGKRNSSIHLLSGGEKALTAIALVFAIFSLNPAPFCLLDEVDAPLDDANVGRYSNLVKEMSRTVQFIYITHNKIAMEMAEQLMGVTMHEPGVSRLVSVDVDEAVAMAAV